MKNKKKIAKIIGGVVGIGAICCIIPACVISCGSSSSSNNTSSSNSTTSSVNSSSTNDNQNNTLLQISASSKSQLTPISVQSIMNSIGENLSSSQLQLMSKSMVVYQTTDNQNNSYTISIDNLPNNGKNLTYNWYSISMTTANSAIENGSTPMDISSNPDINYVDDFIAYGGTLLNNETSTYTYSGANTGMGNVFACKITDGGQTYYSQLIWLESATSSKPSIANNNNNQIPGYGNDPLNVASSSCKVILDNTNIKPSSTSSNTYLVPQNTKMNFTLSIPNFNYQDFAKYAGYEVEWTVSNDTGSTITPSYLPLSKASSWNYSIVLPVGTNTVSVNILYDGNIVNTSSQSSDYKVYGVQISWTNAKVSLGQSDNLNETGAYTTYNNANYYWQESTDEGKTWTNISNASGTIENAQELGDGEIPSITIKDITNSTNQYRLKLVNSSDSSQVIYSNVLTSNDTLITTNLMFNNPDYQSEFTSKTWGSAIISTSQKEFYLSISLNQLGKNVTKDLDLKNMTGTLTFNYLSSYVNNQNEYTIYNGNDPFAINVSNLDQYYQKETNTLVIPVNIADVIQNLNAINNYINNTGEYSQITNYLPCQISFSINQGTTNVNDSNQISVQFENVNISVTSNDTEINGVYYTGWDQNISLTSANSMLSFSANSQIKYQWQVSTDNKNWQSLENGTNSTYSGSNNYNQLYYRLKITSLQGSDIVLYSNVIEISSSVPSATLTVTNGDTNVTSFSPVSLTLKVNQNNTTIASSNDIQVVYQYYDTTTNSWQNLTTPTSYTSSYFYPFVPKYTGANKVRVEYTYLNKIVQYTNQLLLPN